MISVFFDGDQTLWDFQAVMRRSLQTAIEELVRLRGPLVGDASVTAFVADRQTAHEHSKAQGLSHEEVRLLAFRHSLARLQVADADGRLAAHLTDVYFARRWAGIELYPDAVPALEALAALPGCRVGLLSNGNSYPERSGLGHLFAATVFSEDVGAPKPHPAMFEQAAADLPADRFVMVGDSPSKDVAGPQAGGWLACWLNRDGRECPDGVHPDLMVTTLAEVVPWVASLPATLR